uniref:TSA: Wollemia nobilis Ref_Wollemi_Transcript_11245_1640 transcribed RNA sequence n=1 Tax=Wollemia nobilis TaxID=56998 RepID=A0A0C9QSU7_9CONI
MQQGPPNAMQISAYSQNPQPQQPSGQSVSIPFSQPEPTPSLAQHMPHSQMPTPALPGNYGPEPPYMPSNYGGSSSHQPPRSMPPPQLPASQRFSGSQQGYEPTFGRTSSGPLPFPPTYGPGLSGPPPYGDSQTYSGPSFRLPQKDSNPSGGGSSAGHPRLPTAKPLQHSLPVASSVNSSPSGSTSSSNRVPVDDVVDKVSSMGFPRDQVKMVVQKLTENGQSVDLNVVLDKLMNGGGGEIQPQKGWFGR